MDELAIRRFRLRDRCVKTYTGCMVESDWDVPRQAIGSYTNEPEMYEKEESREGTSEGLASLTGAHLMIEHTLSFPIHLFTTFCRGSPT